MALTTTMALTTALKTLESKDMIREPSAPSRLTLDHAERSLRQ